MSATRLVMILLLGTYAGRPALAQTFLVFGAGQKSCGEFTQAQNGKGTEPVITYGSIVGWIDGYVTGAAAEHATSSLIWDIYVRGTDQTATEVITARQRYCQQPTGLSDPICELWKSQPVARVADVYPVVRDMPLNERLAWIAGECAIRPSESIKSVGERLYNELAKPLTNTNAVPSTPGVLVGATQYRTSLAGTTALLTLTATNLRLELFGGLRDAVDLHLDGADWIGRTTTSPNCTGAAIWRLHQAGQTLLLEQSCLDAGSVKGGRGLTLVLTKN